MTNEELNILINKFIGGNKMQIEGYHKIKSIYKRDEKTKKLIEGTFTDETIEYLKNNEWEFTEKIDGTNIRVYWDGHRVTVLGRTDNSQIPANLMNRLYELFMGDKNEQLFEQKFGEMQVMLVGEGYGDKIQGRGKQYRDNQDFILFDVKIYDNWQPREVVNDIATYFGIDSVPVVLTGTLQDAVDYVKTKPKSVYGTADSEGVVGRPKLELLDRTGTRIIVKIKVCDFEEGK